MLRQVVDPHGFGGTPWLFWCFFPNSNSFGVFSHSKGFGAELLLDSLWFSGTDPSCAVTRFRGRFHQGFTEVVSRRFHICLSSGCCFRKGSLEGVANSSLHLSPSLVLGPKLHQPYTSTLQKLLLGSSLGLIQHTLECVASLSTPSHVC